MEIMDHGIEIESRAKGQFDLFGGGDAADDDIAGVFDVKIPAEQWESKHQLALESYSDASIARILEGDVPDGTQVTIGGILASVMRRVNKNGESWASAQLEDLAGGIEVLFFPKSFMVHGMSVVEDAR